MSNRNAGKFPLIEKVLAGSCLVTVGVYTLSESAFTLTRIIHERFCCNRRSAAATGLRPAGSRRGSAISRRTVMNNAG